MHQVQQSNRGAATLLMQSIGLYPSTNTAGQYPMQTLKFKEIPPSRLYATWFAYRLDGEQRGHDGPQPLEARHNGSQSAGVLHVRVCAESQSCLACLHAHASLRMERQARLRIDALHLLGLLVEAHGADVGKACVSGELVLVPLHQPLRAGEEALHGGVRGQLGAVVRDELDDTLSIPVVIEERVMFRHRTCSERGERLGEFRVEGVPQSRDPPHWISEL